LGGYGGGRAVAAMDADVEQTGFFHSSGDHVAGGISLMTHTHTGCQGGSTGGPQ